jgi:ornithine cyclodeaminase/alanine dehydrogenase-like protein (mu-crystallin family)
VGRDVARTASFVGRVVATGLAARAGNASDVADADVVVCATTSGVPVFEGGLVRGSACVVAVGSHEPGRRELDAVLMGQATVVVEDLATALREAGDVALAVSERTLQPEDVYGIADLVAGRVPLDPARPRVFKSVGMAWQDLVTAAEIHRRAYASPAVREA